MKEYRSLLALILALFFSMSMFVNAQESEDHAVLIQSLHLPPTTKVAAEERDLIVFTHVDSIYDDMDVVTLWTYRPKTGELLKLLTTNPKAAYDCLHYGEKAQKVSITSIPTIFSVYINAETNKILVEGHDDRNIYSYIITLTDELPTIQLPCNAGILGLSSEESLPIGQSYTYYKHGGRYSIVSVFDWNGKCLKHISLRNMGK